MISVGIVGAGQLGEGVATALRARREVAVLGPAARADRADVLTSRADVVVIATATLLAEVLDDIRAAVLAGSNVIVSAEEAAYPWAVDATSADELDLLARERGVTVVGGGLNPGFLFDSLVLTLCGVHSMPTSIEVTRVVDLSGFGAAVRRRLGLGYTPAEFTERYAAGTVLGHAGFRQSIEVVAYALGLSIDAIRTTIEPVIGDSGRSTGFVQEYGASVAGRPWFVAEFVGFDDGSRQPRDHIMIQSAAGRTEFTVDPGVPSQAGSAALIANSVDRTIAAPAGWLTVGALPPAHAGGVRR